MRLLRDLRLLQSTALHRLARIRPVAVNSSLAPMDSKDRDIGVSYAIIELYTLWHSFSRFLYISAALGAKDGSGTRVTSTVPHPSTIDVALTPAIRLRRRYRTRTPPWRWVDEPSWANPTVLLDSLSAVSASNRSTVSAGLSTPSTVFVGLAPFRHFFAHRGRDTRQPLSGIARNHSIPPDLRPSEMLLTKALALGTPRTQPLLLDWIDEIGNAVQLMV